MDARTELRVSEWMSEWMAEGRVRGPYALACVAAERFEAATYDVVGGAPSREFVALAEAVWRAGDGIPLRGK